RVSSHVTDVNTWNQNETCCLKALFTTVNRSSEGTIDIGDMAAARSARTFPGGCQNLSRTQKNQRSRYEAVFGETNRGGDGSAAALPHGSGVLVVGLVQRVRRLHRHRRVHRRLEQRQELQDDLHPGRGR